jgi:capsular exopolysaccharide synthesis family protein
MVSGVALGLAGAVALTATSQPLYVSTAKVYVSTRTPPDSTSLMQGSQFAQQQIASYAQIATSPLVLEPVIARLNLPDTTSDLAGQISATSPVGTSLIELNVKGSDSRETALIVNAVADELIKALATLETPTTSTTSTASPVRGTIVQRGVAPTRAISPRPAYNAGLGLLLGLLLGALASLARESSDTRARNRPDFSDEIGVGVLGSLTESPQLRLVSGGQAIPTQRTLDDFRRIRINLLPRLQRATGSTVLVTSATAGEGKTTLATGLAAALAEDVPRVLVVDADLRTAGLSRRLAPHTKIGLSQVLDGSEPDIFNAVVTLEGFNLLPAGGMVPSPSALLTRRLLTPVLEQLTSRYDFVLLDAPSVDASSDAAGLSPLAAMTVLVADRHRTPGPAVRAAVSTIEAAGGQVIGAVVNGHREEKPRRRLPLGGRAQVRHLNERHEGASLEQRSVGARMAGGVRGLGERLRHVRRDVPGRRPALPVVRRPEPLSGTQAAGDVPGA